MSTKFKNNMTDIFYMLPLWLQIFIQTETDTYIRGLLRKTSNGLNAKFLLIKADYDYAKSQHRIGWYRINKDYNLMGDDSEEGTRVYNYYDKLEISSKLFLTNKL